MRFVLRQGDRETVVEVEREGDKLSVALNGKLRQIDLAEGDQGLISLLVDGQAHACDFDTRKGNQVRVYVGQSVFEVELETELDSERRARRQLAGGGSGAAGPQVIVAPMPGKVVRLLVKVGQPVKAGDGLVVIEAMKMENELRSARAGTVKEISVAEGAAVEGGARLCVVE
jgi:biotin carboxyl carrier protein